MKKYDMCVCHVCREGGECTLLKQWDSILNGLIAPEQTRYGCPINVGSLSNDTIVQRHRLYPGTRRRTCTKFRRESR